MNFDSSFGVPVVTIDGPGGAGKGTLAAAIAEVRGWHLLDSGALYRIIAVVALRQGVSLSDAALLAALCSELQIVFGAGSVTVNGDDLTDAIRTEDVGSAASVVAALPPVREAILTPAKSVSQSPRFGSRWA